MDARLKARLTPSPPPAVDSHRNSYRVVRTPSLNEVLSAVRSMLKAVRGACVGLRFTITVQTLPSRGVRTVRPCRPPFPLGRTR
jgi:hypothetical protein